MFLTPSCYITRMLHLFFIVGALSFSYAQDQRFYFPNQQQARFVQSFQAPNNGYYQQDVSSFRQNSPGFAQNSEFLEGDLQTSDLPPHLAQTLPQYQFSRFAQPTVQHPVPFQLPSKNNNPDAYLYDDDNSSRGSNQQVPRPQPFKLAKPATAKPLQQQHSHYLTHGSHGHDPSQTETFLGQITLQSPDLPPDFNPDIPAFRPSKDFPFQHSSSLVDQFSQGSDKWRKPNVPVVASRPARPRASNKPFRELSDAVDQNLEDFLDKENHSRERNNRKPSLDRGPSFAQHNSNNNISTRFRPIPPSGREIKSRPQYNNFIVNNNGDVLQAGRSGFRPKPTTTNAPSTTVERRNRFHPTTKSPAKPLAFHLKSNKIPFLPKGRTTTSTTENTFDLESLLEDPVKDNGNGEHFEHDDDVEVIQSVTSPTEPTTTEQEITSTIATESESTDQINENTTVDEQTENSQDSASTESKDFETVDYPDEKIHSTTSDISTEDIKPTETEISEHTTHEDDLHNEYEYEYEDEDEIHGTHLPHITSETLESKEVVTDENESNNNQTHEAITDKPVSTTETPGTTTEESNFDVLTIKPSVKTVETDNFNGFVDSTLIDNNTDEIEKAIINTSSESVTTDKPSTLQDTTITTETISTTTSAPSNAEPVLIGEAVVSVVTTKSVINGTVSIPTETSKVTEQMNSPETNDNSSESWMVIASVQTSRSVSGARYLPFPPHEEDRRAQLLNENSEYSDSDYTESAEQDHDSISENPVKLTDAVKSNSPVSSTESISDKLDRVQSELSSGLLSGGFRNGIAIITEQMPEKTTFLPETSTTTTTTTTTEKPTTTPIPVIIRKFSANLRPTTTKRPRPKPPVFDTIKHDDLTGLLPPGFKPKYQNSKTTTTQSAIDLDMPQGDEPSKSSEEDFKNGTVGRSSGITLKNKVTIQDNLSSFIPPGYKVPKESDLPNDPVKTLEDFLGKVRSQAANGNKSRNSGRIQNKPIDISHLVPKDYKSSQTISTTEKSKNDGILPKAVPVDISAFLPPNYKPSTTTEKSNESSNLLPKAQPVDISAFLPPGYKLPKEDKPKNVSNILTKAEPIDISAFLPPGYKAPKTQKDTPKPENKTDKPKGVAGHLADAVPVDISAFLPPGYTGFKKGKFTTTQKTSSEVTEEVTSPKTIESSSVVPSTTASSGFKVVFPSRPGGRKPIHRLTTPKTHSGGEGSAVTPPAIQKGWPSRATTEFTGWPTPSTTPISIEKLLEAARTATSLSSSSEIPTVPVTTTSTTTTTTTTPAPTTPGICVGECDLAGTIKLIGGAQWEPELLDHNTKEWQILANEVQTQLEKAYSKSAILSKWYKKIRIDEFSPGSVLVDYTVELTDLGRTVDTMELKSLFNEVLSAAPAASARSISGKSETIREGDKNTTKLALGSFIIDPHYTDFIVLSKNVVPTVGYAEDNVFLPQWAIAVIVIGLASLLFVIIFGVTVLVNRQKNAKKKQPIPLTEEMLNELNKNHMGGLDNYGADDLYNMEDVWNDKTYDMKPPKKRSAGSIHDNSMSNLYDSWRSEWNGYYYNAYYGNNAGGSSNGGFQRRRSDYDTNF